MKSTVTVYERAQIRTQFDVIGFEKAVSAALVYLARDMELNIIRLRQDCVVTCTYLSKNEWACTLESKGEEVYGLTVEKAS